VLNDLALIAFWTGIVWIAYTYAGYPMLLWLIGLVSRVRHEQRDDFLPTVSVLIAARNEEQDIGWKVAETLAWDYPPDRLEVLVASDASEDRTDEIVSGIADPRLKLVRMDRRSGKGRALNRLAELAHGELVFFTDANAHIAAPCLKRMVGHFADCKVGCVTGHSYSGLDQGSPVAETGTVVYWGHELLVKSLESRLGSVLACDGAIFCMRRCLYSPVSPELANDLELPLRVFRAGYQVRFEPRARVVEKDTASPAQEFSRRRRICAQGVLAMIRLQRTLRGMRALQFLSCKVSRWLTIVPLLLLLVSSAALMDRVFFGTLFALQAAFYAAGLAGALQASRTGSVNKILAVPLYVAVSSIGALTGIFDALRGRRFDVWESPILTRGGNGPALGNV
jgi:cellulose synthase/poly-beta-1,6-N-acetylglucosamine synthase-like glycosyltransferase